MYNSFLNFDLSAARRVERMGKQDNIPNGMYKAVAKSARWRAARDSEDCCYWHLMLTILDGEYEGYSIPVRFSCMHPNPEVVEMAQGQLAHYMDCIGVTDPQNSDDLCNVPVLITVLNKRHEFTGSNGKEVDTIISEVVRFDPLTIRFDPPAPVEQLESEYQIAPPAQYDPTAQTGSPLHL